MIEILVVGHTNALPLRDSGDTETSGLELFRADTIEPIECFHPEGKGNSLQQAEGSNTPRGSFMILIVLSGIRHTGSSLA
jgi:hypothetical protein